MWWPDVLRRSQPEPYARCLPSGRHAVTPGIRFADAAADDQVRITTPARAREIGSDFIVVGRPITAAADPVAAYERCMKEFTLSF